MRAEDIIVGGTYVLKVKGNEAHLRTVRLINPRKNPDLYEGKLVEVRRIHHERRCFYLNFLDLDSDSDSKMIDISRIDASGQCPWYWPPQCLSLPGFEFEVNKFYICHEEKAKGQPGFIKDMAKFCGKPLKCVSIHTDGNVASLRHDKDFPWAYNKEWVTPINWKVPPKIVKVTNIFDTWSKKLND
jgi:hypothetical protein